MLSSFHILVQAERCWQNRFRDDRTAIGFEQSQADPYMVHKSDDGDVEMVVIVHVDDNLAHAKDQATMERLTAELGSKFKVKSMVETFGVEKANRTPASSGVPTLSKLDKLQASEEKESIVKIPYREAVEARMWTVTTTRPYIACAVRAVTGCCEDPGLAHDKKALLKVMHYLFLTKKWRFTYYGGQGYRFNMEAYTDSDFGACLDSRRSSSGTVVILLAKGAISWLSRMQAVTASGGGMHCPIRGG